MRQQSITRRRSRGYDHPRGPTPRRPGDGPSAHPRAAEDAGAAGPSQREAPAPARAAPAPALRPEDRADRPGPAPALRPGGPGAGRARADPITTGAGAAAHPEGAPEG